MNKSVRACRCWRWRCSAGAGGWASLGAAGPRDGGRAAHHRPRALQWMALLVLTLNFVSSVTYLLKPSWSADALAEASAEVGLLFGALGVCSAPLAGPPGACTGPGTPA